MAKIAKFFAVLEFTLSNKMLCYFCIAFNSLTGRLRSIDLEISITRYRVPVNKRERKCNAETNLIKHHCTFNDLERCFQRSNLENKVLLVFRTRSLI
ncbi:hypothetical protein BpHYR1_003453 [Brachionus plicatilis]|uniref:Uncharacterized protein n=1 Tax=Brachionus plicatilis TaxID=10195 RepID=A0A3M7TAS0_BRAPC|nr:hypothetical protein BpHYR1_003453 [Brachionus plicatilis]